MEGILQCVSKGKWLIVKGSIVASTYVFVWVSLVSRQMNRGQRLLVCNVCVMPLPTQTHIFTHKHTKPDRLDVTPSATTARETSAV